MSICALRSYCDLLYFLASNAPTRKQGCYPRIAPVFHRVRNRDRGSEGVHAYERVLPALPTPGGKGWEARSQASKGTTDIANFMFSSRLV